jgi:hypothetical protein
MLGISMGSGFRAFGAWGPLSDLTKGMTYGQ